MSKLSGYGVDILAWGLSPSSSSVATWLRQVKNRLNKFDGDHSLTQCGTGILNDKKNIYLSGCGSKRREKRKPLH